MQNHNEWSSHDHACPLQLGSKATTHNSWQEQKWTWQDSCILVPVFEMFFCLLRFPSLEIWGKPFNPWWKCSILQDLVALQPPQLLPMGCPSPGVNPVSCVLETGKNLHSPTTSWSAMLFLRILADHTIITTNKAMALSQQDNCEQGFIFISLLQPVIHHSKGSERTFDVNFSLQQVLQTILVSSQPTKLWQCQQDNYDRIRIH